MMMMMTEYSIPFAALRDSEVLWPSIYLDILPAYLYPLSFVIWDSFPLYFLPFCLFFISSDPKF